MTWTLEWSWVAAHRDIFAIGYHPAERIAAALYQLAETGRPRPERVAADDPNRFRLRVEGAEARLFIDRAARTILVTRVYGRR